MFAIVIQRMCLRTEVHLIAITRGRFHGPTNFDFKASVDLARTNGALVLVSNIDCPQIRELYQEESCLIVKLSRAKTIGNAGKRSDFTAEVLIVYDDCGQYDLWCKTAQDLTIHRLRTARGLTSPVQQQDAILSGL